MIIRGIELDGFAVRLLPVEDFILAEGRHAQNAAQDHEDAQIPHRTEFERSGIGEPSAFVRRLLRM